jgi:hypothetical protein
MYMYVCVHVLRSGNSAPNPRVWQIRFPLGPCYCDIEQVALPRDKHLKTPIKPCFSMRTMYIVYSRFHERDKHLQVHVAH